MMMESVKYSSNNIKESIKSNSQIIKTSEHSNNGNGIYSDELNQLDFLNYNQNSFQQQQINMNELNQQLNQTRSQRIRAAMFPESLEDYGYVANQQNGNLVNLGQPPSAVQRLAQPCQVLKTAIVHLINYQEDAEVTVKAIPEILKLLSDDDKLVVTKALTLVDQLSRKDASRFALTSSQPLINALIQLITNTNDSELLRLSASALNNISNHNKQGLLVIFKSGGIPALIKLLSSPMEPVVFYALTTLHNLLMYEDTAKIQIRKCGGIQKMVTLLSTHQNAKFLTLVMDSLQILAFSNSESKLIIAASGGPKEIIRLMRSSNYQKLIWTCVRLMKVLSICPTNKQVLVENGAMQVLSAHLQNPSNDDRIIYNCLLTLRNLSDCAIREDNLDGLIKRLIELLTANTDINVSTCAAGILSNLTCNNEMNKIKFVEYNGIEILLRTMLQAGPENKEDICEPAVCSLRHVTNRHAQAQVAQEAVRYYYGLPVIAPLLQSDQSRWPLLKATIGLIRNLALSDNNLAPLRELGIIPRLVQLLIKAINAHQMAQQNNQDSAVIDDVPMEEIIEGTVGALHQLARDPHNGIVIRELKCIPVLVQLLFMTWESIQRVACGCLSELANDKQSTEQIDHEQITDKLTELLHSKDHAISTYAAAVLFRLSEDKPSNGVSSVIPNAILQNSDQNPYGSNINYAMNNDPNSIYSGANSRINAGSNDQYVSYGNSHQAQDPYEMNPYDQKGGQQQQQQSPATWFDTDL